MKITLLKEVFVKSPTLLPESVWIYKKYDFQFVPPIGAKIEKERVKDIHINKKGDITIYADADKYFYDIYDDYEIQQTSQNILKSELSKYLNKIYLSRGWKIHKPQTEKNKSKDINATDI